MGTEDYTAVTGGSLKLKGVKGSRIEKQKKKKKRTKDAESTNTSKDTDRTSNVEESKEVEAGNSREAALRKALNEELANPQDEEGSQGVGKTEAERRHEERKRKRVSSSLGYEKDAIC